VLTVGLYVSHNALPPSEDDELLAEALRRRGASVEIVAWDDPRERWSDLGIICSTWDYTVRFAEFSAWLDVVDRSCMLLNPLAVIRRTLDKRYLLELSEAGVATVPTRLTSSNPEDVRAVALEQGWSEIILKPLVSAGGRHILRGTPDAVPELPPPVSGSPEGWLVQPLLPAIAAGEYSCVFVAGELTHAVLKRPAAGDFRVQSHYGGRTTLATPPDAVRAAAVHALQVLGAGHSTHGWTSWSIPTSTRWSWRWRWWSPISSCDFTSRQPHSSPWQPSTASTARLLGVTTRTPYGCPLPAIGRRHAPGWAGAR
jgi:glutathione synthase/RimK-type ligase-like ATP-grasp enzyme